MASLGQPEPEVLVEVDARALARVGIHSSQRAQRIFNLKVARQMLARKAALQAALDEDIIESDRIAQLKVICGISLREQELAEALQEYFGQMALAVWRGESVSYDDAHAAVARIAEEHGCLTGVPIPMVGDDVTDMVMAKGVPLAEIFRINQQYRQYQTEAETELTAARVPVRNSWHVLGDQTVCVVDTTEGPMALPRYSAGQRLRKLVKGMEVRSRAHQRAEAELRAMESLRARISRNQYDAYVVSGMFPERSPRSDIWYYFRKGYPTLAISFHGKNSSNGRVLAALCLHPMGFYSGTHVGLMCPTDEVISHLLMMRSDERKFWAKSGQWCVTDSRSGV